jgi:hypothetical protein
MKLNECGPLDEIFEHEDEETKEHRFFNATSLNKLALYACLNNRTDIADWGNTNLDESFINFIVDHRGVEEERIQRLCKPYLDLPVTMIEMADGTSLTVDGHHRMVRLFRDGVKTITFIRIKIGFWEAYVIEDFHGSYL